MLNVNIAAVKQIAATCAAMRMLLSGDRKLRDLQIVGATSFPELHSERITAATMQGCSTLVVIFKGDGSEALLDKMLLVDVSSKKKEMWLSFCSFVQNEDGRFALRLADREQPTEHVFSCSSSRLVRRPVKDDTTRAIAELNGLQALLAKAATPECQGETFKVE